MSLDNPKHRVLLNRIKDGFRVRRNQRPLYVDVGDNLARVGAKQHQVIFGRRGSGKSCLVVHWLNESCPPDVLPVYIMADEFKSLTYPDILIRLLIEIMEALPVKYVFLKKFFRRRIPTREYAAELRKLLDMADTTEVVEGDAQSRKRDLGAQLVAECLGKAHLGDTRDFTHSRTSRFTEKKLNTLERHLRDYKRAAVGAIQSSRYSRAYVFVDDFYLLPRVWHPDVLDYLHRLFRDTDIYLKVATIRYRTKLLRNHPHTVGVELSQDVEEITLDRTLEDLEATEGYLRNMLMLLAKQAGINDLLEKNFNPDAFRALVLTSGGVPRDFLTIYVHAVESAGQTKWLTPTHIYRGAGRLVYQTKLRNLRDDARGDAAGLERLLTDLVRFCLREKQKTAFLISQDEAQKHLREHELIQQLMDFKLIHVVEPDTSAASGRPGRYEAYTLDFSLFMEPRARGFEIVEFWKTDENRRRKGIREAPVYPLERAGKVFEADSPDSLEAVLQETEAEQPPTEVSQTDAG